jgi:lipopolysaccharide/colanic/teichoic acid biosynthesis glycosyltransferase
MLRYKRCVDVILGVGLSGLILPLCAVLSVSNLVFLGYPLFFRQKRIGRYGKPFWILKFRSMGEHPHGTIPQMHQLTRYGRFLRKYSLDELPSWWNVMRGDLSWVGPRPLLPEFFTPQWRQGVPPGMTGLAQIKGRNSLSWRKKFRYDLWYIRHGSMALDAYILWKTLVLLLNPKGTDLSAPEDYAPSPSDDCFR